MVLTIILVVSTIFVFCYGDHTPDLDEHRTTHIIGPPFFVNVTTTAKVAYYKILNNKALTRNQQMDAIIKWGTTNNVENTVRLYLDKENQNLHGYRQNITIFLNQLLEYEEIIDNIYYDDNITVGQRENLLVTLKCPHQMKKILSYVATTVRKYGAPPPINSTSSPTPTTHISPPLTHSATTMKNIPTMSTTQSGHPATTATTKSGHPATTTTTKSVHSATTPTQESAHPATTPTTHSVTGPATHPASITTMATIHHGK